MFDVTQLTTKLTTTVTDATETVTSAVSERLGDLTNFDFTRLDVSKLDLPKLDLPRFEMPRFEMPDVDLPAEVDRVADVIRDATYAGIGAVVIAAQMVDGRIRKLAGDAA